MTPDPWRCVCHDRHHVVPSLALDCLRKTLEEIEADEQAGLLGSRMPDPDRQRTLHDTQARS